MKKQKGNRTEGKQPQEKAAKLRRSGRSIDELRSRYDRSLIIPGAIKTVIAEHLKGSWMYDNEMRDLVAACCSVPVRSRWAEYRDRDEYKQYLDVIDDKRIWLDPKLRGELRRIKAT